MPQPVYMNTNDLAEMAAQKKRDQQMCQYQGYNPNEPCDDSQDLKTPTAENQQTLMENKVLIKNIRALIFLDHKYRVVLIKLCLNSCFYF